MSSIICVIESSKLFMDSYHNILSFPKQFSWRPEIIGNVKNAIVEQGAIVDASHTTDFTAISGDALNKWRPEVEHIQSREPQKNVRIALCGMGGSALAGDIIRTWFQRTDIVVHRDFHLPHPIPELVIAISYSGNTEETLSSACDAHTKRIPLVAIASGGELEKMSHELHIPFIKLPAGYQPREALGFMIRAVAEYVAPRHIKDLEALAAISARDGMAKGEKLAKIIFGKLPLVYTSNKLAALGYNWKIKFNETGKTPAFTGIIPELFHNELTSFNMGGKTKKLAKHFIFILLEDIDDIDEIKKRFLAFKKFMESKKFAVIHEKRSGNTFMERFVRSINCADWTSYFLAKASGADPENVPWVEEFKQRAKE